MCFSTMFCYVCVLSLCMCVVVVECVRVCVAYMPPMSLLFTLAMYECMYSVVSLISNWLVKAQYCRASLESMFLSCEMTNLHSWFL